MPKVFQFPVERTGRARIKPQTRASDTYVQESEQPMVVQGQTVDSKPEWYVALALQKLGVEFIYQYQVLGGNIRGGQIVDFLCMVPPASQAVQVYGEYWHVDEIKGGDKLGIYVLEAIFGKENVHVLLSKDVDSEEKAMNAIRRELNV